MDNLIVYSKRQNKYFQITKVGFDLLNAEPKNANMYDIICYEKDFDWATKSVKKITKMPKTVETVETAEIESSNESSESVSETTFAEEKFFSKKKGK